MGLAAVSEIYNLPPMVPQGMLCNLLLYVLMVESFLHLNSFSASFLM